MVQDFFMKAMRHRGRMFFFFCVFLFLFYFHTHGIFYPDEGYILHSASRIIDGQVIYRDFDFVYTPFSPLFAVVAFMFFGKSIFVARMAAMLVSLLSVFFLYKITKLLAKNSFLQVLPVLVYLAWGPAHINFLWPTMIALFFGLISIFALLKHASFNTKSFHWPFFAGCMAMCTILSKQNFGLAVVISGIIYLFLCKNVRKFSVIGPYTLGILSVSIIFAAWLILTNSYSAFINSFYLNVFQKIVVEGTINTPLVYGSTMYAYLKLLFYLSPVLLSVYAIYISLRRDTKYLIIPLFSLSFFLLGFRPVTDYVHLSPLLSIAGLPLLVILKLQKNRWFRPGSYFFVFVYMAIGVYMPLFVAYYRWSEPLTRQVYFVSDKSVYIWVDAHYSQEIPRLRSAIDSISKSGDSVYVNYYAPMVYFLVDRKNGTKYDYISSNAVTQSEQKDLLMDLEHNHVQIVMTHELAKTDRSIVAQYIEKKYKRWEKINDLTIWKKE